MRNNEERLGVQKQLQDASPLPEQFNTKGDLNFIVPTEYVELPSKGKFYRQGHPLHNQEVVEIRQMTAKEEDILTSKSLLKKGVAIDKLIESVLVNKQINPDLLTIEDRNAIIISARIHGYGPEYATSVACPACNQKSKFTFDLSQKVERDDEEEFNDYSLNLDGNFELELPSTKWKVVCRALNGKDEKATLKMAEAKKKTGNDSFLIDQLLLMIVSIQGVSDLDTLERAIEAMPASDSRFLRRAYSKIVKPFDMTQRFVCSSCEHEADVEVPLSADFFWFK